VRNIKLTLEYDGTHFFGFQKQKRHRSVQSELELALKKLFQKKIKVIASSRTDSGVHAEGQVVNFHVRSKILLSKIQLGLNRYLPEDLAVRQIVEVPKNFHSQFLAKWKTYEYRVLNAKHRSPLKRFRAFQVLEPLNLNKMKQAARLLCGKHDFRAFEASGSRRISAVRTIRKFEVEQKGETIYFTVEANGFLYKMVRSLVGTLLEIGSGTLEMADLNKAIGLKLRSNIGQTVPPQGLTLTRVTY